MDQFKDEDFMKQIKKDIIQLFPLSAIGIIKFRLKEYEENTEDEKEILNQFFN